MGPQGTIEDIYGQRNTRYLYRSCHNIGEQIVFSNQLATLWFVLTGTVNAPYLLLYLLKFDCTSSWNLSHPEMHEGHCIRHNLKPSGIWKQNKAQF